MAGAARARVPTVAGGFARARMLSIARGRRKYVAAMDGGVQQLQEQIAAPVGSLLAIGPPGMAGRPQGERK
jgi:hypothetical protein